MDQVKTQIGELISVRPNWVREVTEVFEYKTSIITSRDGTEQRESLRSSPRHSIEFQADRMGGAARRLHADFAAAGPETRNWPAPWHFVKLSGQHLAGSSVLLFDGDTPGWLRAGTTIVLVSRGSEEVATVDSVAAGSITLQAPTQTELPVGSRANLALRTRFAQKVQQKSTVSTHLGGTVALEVDPGSERHTLPPDSSAGAFEGFPVFLSKIDWSNGPTLEVDDMRQVADVGHGVIDVETAATGKAVKATLTFSQFSKAAVDEVLGFFAARLGRRGAFWLPASRADMTVALPVVQDTNTATVAGQDITRYLGDRVFNVVIATWPDGAVQLNRIAGMALAGENTLLTMENPWQRDIESGVELRFALLARFATDRLTVSWTTSAVATIRLPIRVLTSDWAAREYPVHTTVEWVTVFDINSGYSGVEPWGDHEIDLRESGIPQPAQNAGRVKTHIELGLNATGGLHPTSFLFIAKVEAVDDNGVVIGAMSDNELVTNFDLPTDGAYIEVEIPDIIVPPNARWLRYRAWANTAGVQAYNRAYATSPDWGHTVNEGGRVL